MKYFENLSIAGAIKAFKQLINQFDTQYSPIQHQHLAVLGVRGCLHLHPDVYPKHQITLNFAVDLANAALNSVDKLKEHIDKHFSTEPTLYSKTIAKRIDRVTIQVGPLNVFGTVSDSSHDLHHRVKSLSDDQLVIKRSFSVRSDLERTQFEVLGEIEFEEFRETKLAGILIRFALRSTLNETTSTKDLIASVRDICGYHNGAPRLLFACTAGLVSRER